MCALLVRKAMYNVQKEGSGFREMSYTEIPFRRGSRRRTSMIFVPEQNTWKALAGSLHWCVKKDPH
jgi:hypothetical protein